MKLLIAIFVGLIFFNLWRKKGSPGNTRYDSPNTPFPFIFSGTSSCDNNNRNSSNCGWDGGDNGGSDCGGGDCGGGGGGCD